MSNAEFTVYGTTWCGGARRVRMFLDERGIPYRWVDIDADEAAARKVESLAGGCRSVPTVVWPDGSALVEPSLEELARKLGLSNE